jgi:radical SAM superfamily enzyme YgiQ (UPF0313 family)
LNKNKEIKINLPDANCFPKSLDELPMPAWEKLPFEKYSQISSPHGVDVTENGGKYAPIMTSRGCVWRCLYCHISTEKEDIGNLRTHSIDRVINEVDKLKSLGIERLFFEDDSLFAKKDRAKEIFEKIQSKDISISNVNGVNLIDFYIKDKGGWKVDYKFINTLKKAGFKQMVFPAESGNQRILDKYASGKVRLDKMDLPKLMDALTKEGILSPANMIIGFPDETEKEIKNSLELAKRLRDSGAPYVTFFIPIPFPGSRLYDLAIREGYLKEDFNPDIMNWKNPVMQNTIISQERIVEIRDRANEDINDEEHLKKRLMQSAGFRWRG